MIYHCCQQNRRSAVIDHPILNGIDFLEVLDADAPAGTPRQQTLLLYLLKPVPAGFSSDNVAIVGGERIRDPDVEWVAAANNLDPALATAAEIALLSAMDQPERLLVIRTSSRGDFSPYCLRLQLAPVGLNEQPLPPVNFDPRLVEVTFSFKVECPSDFDCQQKLRCETEPGKDPDINYLAKDYSSLRQLILDRLSYLIPGWTTRNAADLGVTLAELLAYKGDQLSYWQDAVSTEAYLDTARQRVSLRRHSLLVDYRIGEGRNARAWLHLNVSAAGAFQLLPADTQFLTRVEGLRVPDDNRIEPDSRQHTLARQQQALVFEILHNAELREAHNQINFYTWQDINCCLPKGATHATLDGTYDQLSVGDFLLFEEVMGPQTGVAEDADPDKRHVVRLTRVETSSDPLFDGTPEPQPITEIYWQQQDALPFPVCISATVDAGEAGTLQLDNVSLVRGNLILIDHGQSLNESLASVPQPSIFLPVDKDSDHCDPSTPVALPPRYLPRLSEAPLTHAGPAPSDDQAATGLLQPALRQVQPQILELNGDDGLGPLPWAVQADLLNSDPNDRHAVVELDNRGQAQLRFGDDQNGQRPDSGTSFDVRYRVGNGPIANVGADAIIHIVSLDGRVNSVRNPLPAAGGLAPETSEQIRRRAPQAFRTQLRAVTPADYAEITTQQAGVQQAAAALRWTGSWYTQFITVDREGGEPLDPEFEQGLIDAIEPYRMAGHDLELNDPQFVSLQLDLQICVDRNYFRSDVELALRQIFTSGLQSDGQLGLFHPDRFSFGQTVYLSPYYAAARQVAGVSSVQITAFGRQDSDDPKPLADGFLALERLQIARLDNDPNFPEHGVVNFEMLGGK